MDNNKIESHFDKILISIIIPVYNSEKYLEECLESILNQEITNIEVIVIDDGSSDKSVNIIKKYVNIDKRIKAIFKKNKGVSNSRNIGMKIARGRYIAFVDSDDTVEKDIYTNLYSLIKDSDNNIAICSYDRINKSGKSISREVIDKYNNLTIKRESIEQVYYKLICELKCNPNIIMGACWRILIPKKIITKNKLFFNENLSYAEDLFFCLQLLNYVNELKITSKALYHYRVNLSSTLERYDSEYWQKQIQLFNYLNNFIVDNNLLKYKSNIKYRLWLSIISSIDNICKFDNSDSLKEKLNKIKAILNNKYIEDIINDGELYNLIRNKKLKYFLIYKKYSFILFIIFKYKRLLLKIKREFY